MVDALCHRRRHSICRLCCCSGNHRDDVSPLQQAVREGAGALPHLSYADSWRCALTPGCKEGVPLRRAFRGSTAFSRVAAVPRVRARSEWRRSVVSLVPLAGESLTPSVGLTVSKGEHGLHHRHPACHACGIWSERPAIGRSIDLEQLRVHPQSFGGKKMPLHAAAVLV